MNSNNPSHLFAATIRNRPRSLLVALLCAASLTFSARADSSFEAWRQKYDFNSSVSQGGTSVAIDRRGNVAITGYTTDPADNNKIIYTAKYSGTTGELIWEQFRDFGVGDNIANSVVMDSAGNVIVTGGVFQNVGQENFYTVKYAAADGTILWERFFDGPNNGEDEGRLVAVDSADDVIVAGYSNGSSKDIQLLRYSPTGTLNGQFRFTGAQTRVDVPNALVMDSNGFAIVGGTTNNTSGNNDIYLAKISLSTQTAAWTRILDGLVGGDDEGHGVAVDPANNVFISGRFSALNGTHQFHTRKFDTNGNQLWTQTFSGPEGDFLGGSIGVVADAAGNAFVTGSSTIDNFTTSIYTAKYASADGAVLWEKRSPAPDDTDLATGIAIDPAGNPIVTGASDHKDSHDADYYTVKYSGESGAVLWEQRFNGNYSGGGDDLITAVAANSFGDVAITGASRRPIPHGSVGILGIVTIKYGRLLGLKGDDVPGAGVSGTHVPKKAKFTSIGAPAISDNGTIAAKVGFAAGLTKLNGILLEGGGGTSLPAVQGAAAPDVTGGKFKSFNDPVISPSGTIAFVAKLGGVPDANDHAVFTNAINGDLHLALQTGTQAPGLAAGVLVRSISSISLRNGELVALVKLKGTDVTDENSIVLLGLNFFGGTPLLRTEQMLTVGGQPASAITKISVLNPPAGSGGHGRWQADAKVVARVTLADARVVVVSVSTTGAVTPLLFTNQDAAGFGAGAKWKTFGFPGVGTSGLDFAALGTLQQDVGGVTKSNDTALIFSTTGAPFAPFAIENAVAVDAGGAKYSSFLDPVSNANGDVAFLATLKGTGVKASNLMGLWFGAPAALEMVARLGDKAPDGNGVEHKSKFTSFSSVALPGGTNAGPIFLAKIAGIGVTTKNNVGLWGVDSTGLIRQLLRTGDHIGTRKIASMNLLKPLSTATGATRSFNARGGVAVLVTFTDAKKSVIVVGVP